VQWHTRRIERHLAFCQGQFYVRLAFLQGHLAYRDPIGFRTIGAEAKRTEPLTHGVEGRFDCQRGEYGYLYLAETQLAAFAEAFLRDDLVGDPSGRFLRRDKVTRAAISHVELTGILQFVDLRGAVGLTRVGQDAWLTSSEEAAYPVTQAWATAIRRWAPEADGLCWMAKRDNVHFAAILFDDHDPASRLRGEVRYRFGEPTGFAYATKMLARLNVRVT
jgi:hypothetical protein